MRDMTQYTRMRERGKQVKKKKEEWGGFRGVDSLEERGY